MEERKANGIKECYKYYCSITEKHNRVSYKDFSEICYEYNKFMYQSMIEGKEVMMPYGLGSLFVQSCNTNWEKPPIDWVEKKKLGKYVYFTNRETNSKVMRFKWSKKNRNVKHIGFYCFKLSFHNKRNSAKVFQENGGKIYRTE